MKRQVRIIATTGRASSSPDVIVCSFPVGEVRPPNMAFLHAVGGEGATHAALPGCH